jgi:hypothetical protein
VSELLGKAFLALGPGPTNAELGLVADALAEAGDEQAIAVLDAASYGDRKGLDALYTLASANGSSAFVALDLTVVWASGVEGLTLNSAVADS